MDTSAEIQTSFSKELANIADELQSEDLIREVSMKTERKKLWFYLVYGFIVISQVAHTNVPVLVNFMDNRLYFFIDQNMPDVLIPYKYDNELLLNRREFALDAKVCRFYAVRLSLIKGIVNHLKGPNGKYRNVLTSMLILQSILLDRLSDNTFLTPPSCISTGLDIAVLRTVGYATKIFRCQMDLSFDRLLSLATENIPLVFALCSAVNSGMDAFSDDSLIPAYIYRMKVFEVSDPRFHFALLLHARASLVRRTSLISHGRSIFDVEYYGVISVFENLKSATPTVLGKLGLICATMDVLMATIDLTMGNTDKGIACGLNVYIQLLTAKYCIAKILEDKEAYVSTLTDILANLFATVVGDNEILHLFTRPLVTKDMVTDRAKELVQLDRRLAFLYHSAIPFMKDHVPVLMELFIYSHVILEQFMLSRTSLPNEHITRLSNRLLACSKELRKDPEIKDEIIAHLGKCYRIFEIIEDRKPLIDREYVAEAKSIDKVCALVLEKELDDADEAVRLEAKKKDEWINPQMAQFLKKGKSSQPPRKKAKQNAGQGKQRRPPSKREVEVNDKIEVKAAEEVKVKFDDKKNQITTPFTVDKNEGKSYEKSLVKTPSSVIPAESTSVAADLLKPDNSPPTHSYVDAIKTPEIPKPQKKAVNPAHTNAMIDFDDHQLLENHDSRDVAYAYLMVGNYIDATFLKPLFTELSSKYADLQHIFRKSIFDFERELKTLAVVKPQIFESVLKAANIPNFKFLANCLKAYSKRLLVAHAYVPSLGETRMAIARMVLSSLYETKEGKELILKNAKKLGFKEETHYTPLVPFTNVSNRSVVIPSCEIISYELGVISLLEFFGTEYNALKSGGTGPVDIWETRNKIAHRVPKNAEMRVYILEVLADTELGPFLRTLIE